LGEFDSWNDGGEVLVFWLEDLDEIWHNLDVLSNLSLNRLHDSNLDTEGTSSHEAMSHGGIDEFLLWLTGRDEITHNVLLGLCSLSSSLTSDNNLDTDGTSSHDTTHNVVNGSSNWGSGKELELEVLSVGSSAESSVVVEWSDGDFNLVVIIIEVVSLFDERFDFSDSSSTTIKELVVLGGLDSNFGGGGGSFDLDTGVSFHTKNLGEESVELSVEDSIGNELLLGVKFLNSSFVGCVDPITLTLVQFHRSACRCQSFGR